MGKNPSAPQKITRRTTGAGGYFFLASVYQVTKCKSPNVTIYKKIGEIFPDSKINFELKSKTNRNFLPKSSFRQKFLFLLKETETNFCLFGFGLAETESLLQISGVNRNVDRNLVSSEP